MAAMLSRDFILNGRFKYEMAVIHLRAPTYPDTQAGEPPYLAVTERQVRYWSVCQNEPLTTSVVRCVGDNQATLKNGYATFVISDPSRKPSDTVLAQWGAHWIAWGALQPGDIIYDIEGNPLGIGDPVFYNGLVLYRQTMANSSWTQSMYAVGQLERSQWKSAMGDYWPLIGYCTAAAFQVAGAGCIAQ